MKTRALALLLTLAAVVLLVSWLPSGCSKDDPVTSKCDEVCAADDKHPCKAMQQECLQFCNTIGAQAKTRGHMPEACATCLSELVGYSGWRCKSAGERCTFGGAQENCEAFSGCTAGGAGEECFGVNKNVQFEDPKCTSVCYAPDAGGPRGF